MASFRLERAANLIRQEISRLIMQGDVKDPRVNSLVVVNRVEVSKDLDYARIFVSGYFDDEELNLCVTGLNSAGGFIQSRLAKRFSFRNTPKLRFIADRSIRQGFEITERLKHLDDNNPAANPASDEELRTDPDR